MTDQLSLKYGPKSNCFVSYLLVAILASVLSLEVTNIKLTYFFKGTYRLR